MIRMIEALVIKFTLTKHRAYMCVSATKGTYRRDIKMIVNHDYIKQCIISAKTFRLITLANIVYFPFNCLLHAFIHLNTPISDVLCVHVASSVFFA